MQGLKPILPAYDRVLVVAGPRYGDILSYLWDDRNGIEHIVASVRRPSTIGKIEAFHKAYAYEAWMYPSHQSFVTYWNYERPHQGIGYLYPADVYFRDLRDTS